MENKYNLCKYKIVLIDVIHVHKYVFTLFENNNYDFIYENMFENNTSLIKKSRK